MSADADGLLSAPPVAISNRRGRGAVVLTCEHASAFIPAPYLGLGLSLGDQQRHIGWDLGALQLARVLSSHLDAPLAHATYSRLLLDVNRPIQAPDSIVSTSEGTPVPGNQDLSDAERERRQRHIYAPFHQQLDELIGQRLAAGLPTAVVSIHSFTPNYHGRARPWHVGVISRDDRRLSDSLLRTLGADAGLCVGDNLPYGPQDGVYHSVQRHAADRGLRGAMIEVRNDLLQSSDQAEQWGARLADALRVALRLAQPNPPAEFHSEDRP